MQKILAAAASALVLAASVSTPVPAQEGAAAAHGPAFECTIGSTNIKSGVVHTLTARLGSVDACKSWGADTNHLDVMSGRYELLVHDQQGKLVLHQVCVPPGIQLFGTEHVTFQCKDQAS